MKPLKRLSTRSSKIYSQPNLFDFWVALRIFLRRELKGRIFFIFCGNRNIFYKY